MSETSTNPTTQIKMWTIKGKVLGCNEDTKKIYNLVNSFTGSIKTNPMPVDTSEESSAEKIADYFMGKIERMRDELKDVPVFQPSQSPNLKSNLNEFKPTTKVIQSMATKSCESDALPMNTVKQELHQLLLIIPRVVNLSLTWGIFSDSWKTAIVRQLLKC